MAEEDCPKDWSLLGPEFWKIAKVRVDAIKSLAGFFDLATPQEKDT